MSGLTEDLLVDTVFACTWFDDPFITLIPLSSNQQSHLLEVYREIVEIYRIMPGFMPLNVPLDHNLNKNLKLQSPHAHTFGAGDVLGRVTTNDVLTSCFRSHPSGAPCTVVIV